MQRKTLCRKKLHKVISSAAKGSARDALLIGLMGLHGLRAGELRLLRAQDVDLKSGRLNVGAGAPAREIELHPLLIPMMQQALEGRNPTALLFEGYAGALTPRQMEKLVARHGTKAGHENLTPRALRDCFAVHFLSEGGKPGELARALGSSSAAVARYFMLMAKESD